MTVPARGKSRNAVRSLSSECPIRTVALSQCFDTEEAAFLTCVLIDVVAQHPLLEFVQCHRCSAKILLSDAGVTCQVIDHVRSRS